ncbi:ABC transporter permease subunit [Actinomadura rupiterrae]|uniref:ABC transporter permease subunit n=1 Tax=Actinomadura rupiterrae TaxID=559627 RepID=UPI0020A3F6E2|nr:ABC transporter permease subunit [Actinomadura rupiterrae]MCP2338356.1 ABC-type transport system involved in multi-copper enzyme maturation permease subunit [Actinomadura rupiterrae]
MATIVERDTPTPPASFADAFAAEWIKIRTVRSTFWTLLAGILVTIGLSVLLASFFVSAYDQLNPQDKAQFDPTAYGLVGINFGMVAFGVLGVLVITGEYATGMIRTSLTAVPRRPRLLAAKALVLGLVVLVVGEAVAFAAYFLSQLIFASKNLDEGLGHHGVLRAVIGGGLYLTLIALFALAIGTLLRHTAGSVTTVLGLLFVLPIIGTFLPGDLGRTIRKLLPSNAGGAVMSTRPTADSLSPWTGIGVFALYTVVLLVIALVVFQKRDA